MNRRNTIILVALFALLLGYAYYTQTRPVEEGKAATTPSPTPVAVLDFVTDKVTQLQVSDLKKKQTVAVTRAGETWHMTLPKESATDPFRVQSIIGALGRLKATRVITNVTDLAPFGLTAPSIEARVTLSDSTQYVLRLGDQNPDKNSYYALKGDDKQVYLIPADVGQDLQSFIQEPPYPPTATPTPLPTLTPMTPTSTPTPTPYPTLAPASATPPTEPASATPPTETPAGAPAPSPAPSLTP